MTDAVLLALGDGQGEPSVSGDATRRTADDASAFPAPLDLPAPPYRSALPVGAAPLGLGLGLTDGLGDGLGDGLADGLGDELGDDVGLVLGPGAEAVGDVEAVGELAGEVFGAACGAQEGESLAVGWGCVLPDWPAAGWLAC